MANDIDFSGTWHCTYWFPSNERVGDDPSEYDMQAHRDGDDVVFESVTDESKAYMFIRLHIEDNIASGNWHETTSPTGLFKGAQYSGAGQLVVNSETGNMEGKWAGAGYDYKLQTMRVYTGNWEITRVIAR